MLLKLEILDLTTWVLADNKTKKILITGGAGFIGSHLCKTLINENHYIICLDNLLTGSINNISELMNLPNFEFVKHDIIEPYYREGINEIYNLACPASPIQYKKNPIKTIKTCTAGVINMLGLAKKNNAKILQASTSEVYGNPKVHPQPEQYNGDVNPIGPRSCYDEGKRCSETLFFEYKREHNLDIRIIRIFNTYGPNMAVNDGRVVSNFINQSISKNNITIYGEGLQTRSFMYIDDLIDAMVLIMGSKDLSYPINVGNPLEISIIDLANKILDISKSTSKMIYEELPKDDPVRRKPDISKIKSLTTWRPKTSLDVGLKKTISYFKHLNEKN
jgi:UDP-glucuronate decarboxylase